MGTKVRKQLYIEPEQERMLKRMASETGMSEAEIIREAIMLHAGDVAQPTRSLRAWKRMKAFIAKRMERGPIQGSRMWRREDLYDR